MPNRTLRSSTRNVTGGTEDIFVSTVSSSSLEPGSWVKVNDDQTLVSKATIETSDVDGLDTTLGSLAPTNLTSAGGATTLVVDGTGPDISVKGITPGPGVTLTPLVSELQIGLTDPGPFLNTQSGGIIDADVIVNGGISANGGINLNGFNIDAATNKVVNLADPTDPQDAATRNYVDNENNNYLPLDGSVAMTGYIQNLRTSDIAIHLGNNAGLVGQQQLAVAIGGGAGATNQSQKSVAIGSSAGRISQSTRSTAIGEFAGYREQGADSVAIGEDAGKEFQGDFCIAVGCGAGKNNQPQQSIVLAAGPIDTVPSSSNEMIFRAGATTFVANTTSITHQGASIAGDFKSDGSVSMTGALDAPNIVPTGGKVDVYGGLYVGGLVNRRPVMSGGWTQYLDGPFLLNTTVEATLLGTGIGSLTIPANTMKVGSTSHAVLGGQLRTRGNSESITIRVLSGGTELYSGLFTFAQALNAFKAWKMEFNIVVAAIGDIATGVIKILGSLTFGDATNQSDTRTVYNLRPIDTTVANTFDVRAAWTTADVDNVIFTSMASTHNVYQPQ